MKTPISLVSLICLASLAIAQENIEGEYTRKTNNCFVSTSSPDGWDCEAPLEEGVAIKRRNQDSYYVFLKTRGANGHFCEYNGVGRMSGSVLVTSSKDPECQVSIHVEGNKAGFTSKGDGCNMYCGARSTLDAGDLKKKVRPAKKGRNG